MPVPKLADRFADVRARVDEGESKSSIARDLGVSRTAVTYATKRGVGPSKRHPHHAGLCASCNMTRDDLRVFDVGGQLAVACETCLGEYAARRRAA